MQYVDSNFSFAVKNADICLDLEGRLYIVWLEDQLSTFTTTSLCCDSYAFNMKFTLPHMLLLTLAVVGISLGFVNGAYRDPHCTGNRDGIVHLFEWKWTDIAKECKEFLGPYGYCAVQTSPANENRIIPSPNRPWWERYQPVSYKLSSTRSGNEQEFKDMVEECNKSGVRIYVDVVVNHMTGKGGKGKGTGGTSYDGDNLQFPGVPYGPTDFNDGSKCKTADGSIHNYNDVNEVRNCNLVALLDLKLEKAYVREAIAKYLNHLVELGVAGFRVDAAKHMWPGDVAAVLKQVKDVKQGGRPFVYQEVIDNGGGEAIKASEYLATGRVTNFIFGLKLGEIFRKKNPMKYLVTWGQGWGMWKSEDVVNFIDNHDNQRGHGGGGNILTFKDPKPYKLATAFMLAYPYGFPRIMSSFHFTTTDQGPPHNSDMSIKSVDMTGFLCKNGWVCEHRWRQIYNMVAFRNMASGTGVDNWWSGADYQIAFSRGNKAFIAINLESTNIETDLQTGLTAGTYCDVISGDLLDGKCTGTSVQVGSNGKANIKVCSNCDDPMIAIHIGAKVGSPVKRH